MTTVLIHESPTARLEKSKDLIRCTFRPGARVEEADAWGHVQTLIAMCEGLRLPVCVDLRQIVSQAARTRAIYAGEDSAKFTRYCALLISSPVSQIIGSFFLKFNKPLYPTRLFTSEEAALAWLHEMVATEGKERAA